MHRPDVDDKWSQLEKGDWYFNGKIREHGEIIPDAYIVLKWGDGENDIAVLKIKGETAKWEPVWQWNGDKESPTLSPSIRVLGGQGNPDLWHGYLRAGKLETC